MIEVNIIISSLEYICDGGEIGLLIPLSTFSNYEIIYEKMNIEDLEKFLQKIENNQDCSIEMLVYDLGYFKVTLSHSDGKVYLPYYESYKYHVDTLVSSLENNKKSIKIFINTIIKLIKEGPPKEDTLYFSKYHDIWEPRYRWNNK